MSNYVFHVDVEDLSLLTVNELKDMYGACGGKKTKKEIVDYLTSKLKPIVGDKIVLAKFERDFENGGLKEYPSFGELTQKKLLNLCEYFCINGEFLVSFKKREYAEEYVDWVKARGKKVMKTDWVENKKKGFVVWEKDYPGYTEDELIDDAYFYDKWVSSGMEQWENNDEFKV